MSNDGVPKYSSRILLDNRLCSTFRTGLEEWLRLLLVFDSNRRGFRNSVRKNVFEELKILLNKKMLKVFSVYNYRQLDYEITSSTTLSDVKSLLARDTQINVESQIFAMDSGIIHANDDTHMVNFFREGNALQTLYIFKKNDSVEQRTVNTQSVQPLFQSCEMKAEILKMLYGRAMLFIRDEKESMEHFDAALMIQIQETATLAKQIEKKYPEVRYNLTLLLSEINCYRECSGWLYLPGSLEDQTYLNCVLENRTGLRKSKELVECFNGITEKYLKILGMPDLGKQAEDLRKCCLLNETNMAKHYDDAVQLYERAGPSDTSTGKIADILSEVLKIPSKGIFRNETLKANLSCSLRAQRRLQKLWTSCCAIGDAINEVSTSLRNCMRDKCEYERSLYTNRTNEGPNLHFPRDLEEDSIPTEELLKDNVSIRYRFEEESGRFQNVLRNVRGDTMAWDCVAMFPNQNCP